MKVLILLFLIANLSFSGCGYVSQSTLDKILEKDPSFRKLLSAKKQLDKKILALEEKKAGLNAQIALLREETSPAIQTLEAKLEKIRAEYSLKKNALKDSKSSLKNIRKLLDRKSKLLLTGDEISVWNKRIRDLEKEITTLHTGLDSIKSQTRLIKTEIKILKK
jgi:cell division protein FtsB